MRFFLLACLFWGAHALVNLSWSQGLSALDSAQYFLRLEQYPKAVSYGLVASREAEVQSGKDSAPYALALTNLGFSLTRNHQFAEADSVLRRALAIRMRLFGLESAEVATTLNNLGGVSMQTGKFPQADSLYRLSLNIREKVLRSPHPDVATSYRNLGLLSYMQGDIESARPYLEKYLGLSIQLRPENDPELAQAYAYAGYIRIQTGELDIAADYFKKSLAIRKKALPADHPQLAESLQMLGILWNERGSPGKAEVCFQRALDILTRVYGENGNALSTSVNNLATIYFELGLYSKAEPYYKRAIDICRATEGDSSIELPLLYNNLGNLYDLQHQTQNARGCYEKALAIQRRTIGEQNPEVAWTYQNIGVMEMGLGRFKKAGQSLQKAIQIWESTLGSQHTKVNSCYLSLGQLYDRMGLSSRAEPMLKKHNELLQGRFGARHPDLAVGYQTLGLHYHFNGRASEAEQNFLLCRKNVIHQIDQIFPYLSDGDKEKFIQKLEPVQSAIHAYCVSRAGRNPAITAALYNHQMATKAILLQSSAKWKHRIRNSGNATVKALFEEWEGNQNRLAVLLQSPDSSQIAERDSLQRVTDKLEKQLSQKSAAFSRLTDRRARTWKDVQNRLKPGEAAVEIIRIQALGLSETLRDSSDEGLPAYPVQGLSDTIWYAALVVKKTSPYPELVLLKNGNELENKYIHYYKNLLQRHQPDRESYRQFWQKIDRQLKGIKTIWVSPDGVYHHINLNTLQNPQTGKPLLEEKDIRVVTVTRDLVRSPDGSPNPRTAYLFGFPNFEAPFEQASGEMAQRSRSPELAYRLAESEQEVEVGDLPATKVEIEKISDLLSRKGWQVRALTREKALETSLKESYKPRLLHIATHGFFYGSEGREGNPLLRSGLLLASAANTLNHRNPEEGDDGILTAYEAMNLNLDNTDLVVLSACETGLGEVHNGEGVYGLQRAFQVAGAKSLIMSLWKVDDEATQELMVRFYRHWLSQPGSRREAFRKAQLELRQRYPQPYYWGAFVMMGE